MNCMLVGLTEKYMHLGLMKDAVRMSNWETRVLSYEQQMYAANDAFASLRLYQVTFSAYLFDVSITQFKLLFLLNHKQ